MPKRKPPHSVRVLHRWIGEEAKRTQIAVARMQRWVSFTVLMAALDRARNKDRQPLFVIKGGVAVELRLLTRARATKDLDASFTASEDELLTRLDDALAIPHGDFTFSRGEPEKIPNTEAYRFDIKLAYRGRSWSSVRLEVAPSTDPLDHLEAVPAFEIDHLGLEGPTEVVCVDLPLQIAQKLHACTAQWSGRDNDRFRDLIDLLLLRDLLHDDDLVQVRDTCVDLFSARSAHTWPPTLTVPESWIEQYAALAQELNLEAEDVYEAAEQVQVIIDEIDARSG